MNKILKIVIDIIVVIAIINISIVAAIVVAYVFSELQAKSEKKEITNNAILYIRDKYDVNESEIKLSNTNLYGEHERCFLNCYENTTDVQFADKKCLITYYIEDNYYTDDCQGKELKTGFEKHLKEKFVFLSDVEASTEAEGTPIKYDDDIDDYFRKVNQFNTTKEVVENYGISAKIWIMANNNSQAKDIYQKEIKALVVYLEKLGLHYSVSISKINTDYEEDTFYYIEGYEESFKVVDNVDNNTIKGPRSDYKDGSFIK